MIFLKRCIKLTFFRSNIIALSQRYFWKILDLILPDVYLRERASKRIYKTHSVIKQQLKEYPEKRIRIGFVVCDKSKWSAGPLFEILIASPHFDCGFYIIPSDVDKRRIKEKRRENYLITRDFFENIGDIWGDLYDVNRDTYLSDSVITGDVIFFQQPWGMQELPRIISKTSLCCYFNYAYSIIQFEKGQYALPNFHRYLWRLYVQNTYDENLAKKSEPRNRPSKNAIVLTGYPKFDRYRANSPSRQSVAVWPRYKNTKIKRVIYAPHHAIGKNTLKTSTFYWSADVLERLAIKYKEIDFILKPHPNLQHAVLASKLMDSHKFEKWLEHWKTRENCNIFDTGEYFDLFRTSDLMITDSISFLAEYLPTQSPIIRLDIQGSYPLNIVGQKLQDGFYSAENSSKLEQLFVDIIINEKDPLKEIRNSKSEILMPSIESASSAIMEDLYRSI